MEVQRKPDATSELDLLLLPEASINCWSRQPTSVDSWTDDWRLVTED